ncbi:MAG: glycosyltransferase family 39 protein [Ardenticatenaceae bacterium]|nr:glycosyltransferase family 39 protein [Ardenticatenaceae bacterium]
MPRPRLGLLLLVLGALGLAALGQVYFLKRPAFFWDGLVFYLLAVLAFTLAGVRVDPLLTHSTREADAGFWGEMVAAAKREPWRVVALLLAATLTASLLRLLRIEPQLPNYNQAVLFWLGATGFYILAVAPPRRRPRLDLGLWWEINRRIVLVVAVVLLAALGLRVWQLGSIPPTLGGDEGSQGLEALKILAGAIRNPFATGWLSVPTMSFYFNAPTIKLLGNTIFALRLPWALVGTVTVLVVFWLVTRLKGLTLGLMTAALLATYHYHIHFSRLGSNQVADPFFVALALLFLYRARDRRSPLDWALCGVVIGLAQYFYAGARFTVVIIAVLTLSFLVRDGARFWHEQRQGVLIMLGAAVVTAAPMIQFAIRFPNDYNARLNQVGIIQSGWLEHEQVVRNQGALPILLDQTRRAALAFNLYPDRTVWYGSPKPLFDFAAGALFLLGLGYATLRLDDRRLFPMVIWWWGAMFLGGALTESPPSSQRLITLAPPAVFFVALALLRIGQIAQRAWGERDLDRLTPYLAAAILALSLSSVKWYFVDYTPLRVYGSYNGVVATALGEYARDVLGPDWRIYFFGPPRMYVGFGSIPYLAPNVEGVDIHQPLTVPPDRGLAPADKGAAFVFLPERREELALVRQTFPGSAVEEIPSPLGGTPLFIVYRVPRGQLTR